MTETRVDVAVILRSRLEERSSRGLATAMSSAIRDGDVGAGDRLPPIRELARRLQLSPTTVSAAWAMLRRSGALHTDGRRGTTVGRSADSAAPRLRRTGAAGAPHRIDLSGGVPDARLLPDLRAALRAASPTARTDSYLEEPTLPELRRALAADWPYEPPALAVADGAMDGIEMFVRTSLQFGDRVVLEHPCFPPMLDLLAFVGARIVPVGLDDEGMRLDELEQAMRQPVAAVFLQPRAQNPTGVTTSASRLGQIARIIKRSGAMVVEDDSAGFAASSPAISIGSTLPEQTIHVRSFSKSHGPELRLAALSGPAAHLERIAAHRQLGQGWTSRLLQRVLVHLLVSETSRAQVDAARTQYRRRREALVAALGASGVRVGGSDGINIWVPVMDETAAVIRLAAEGILVAPGGPFMARPEHSAHIRVTSGLVSVRDATGIAAQIAAAAEADRWSARR